MVDNRSPIHAIQEKHGATFTEEDGGWFWSDNFGDTAAEFQAIRETASMWDVFALQKWDITGPDAARAAQRLFTANLSTLQDGQVRYGAICAADGLMIDDGTVFKVASDHFWVLTNSPDFAGELANEAGDLAYSIENRTHQMPVMSIQGPKSREILQGLTEANLSDLRYFRFWSDPVPLGGVPVRVSRTGFSGELGFELIPRPEDAEQLWLKLVDSGVTPVGTDAVQIARIESGLIIIETDYFVGKTSPFDVSLDKMISFDVDYVAKPVLQAQAAAPPNRLKTLQMHGDVVPEAGAAVLKDGEPVGTVTSPTGTPDFGPIALAVIKTGVSDDGTILDVEVPGGSEPATVTHLSIHDPDKRKPRS